MSHNLLMKIPVSSMTNMAALTLCQLDLSHNNIASIHNMDLSNKFRVYSAEIEFINGFANNILITHLVALHARSVPQQTLPPR